MNENLYSSETNSATNSPHYQNIILYKKLINNESCKTNNSNHNSNSVSINLSNTDVNLSNLNNHRHHSNGNNIGNSSSNQSGSQPRLNSNNNENNSSIFGYDSSSVRRDAEMCAFDATTHGISNDMNPQIMDSLSTLSDHKKRIIVRIVTIFSIILFLICFGMIALTLRMSEKIDAQSE